MKKSIDWETVGDILEGVAYALKSLAVLSDGDFEQLRRSWLTYGLVASDAFSKFQRGTPPIWDKSGHRRAELVALVYGLSKTAEPTELLPGHIIRHMRSTRTNLEIVREGISDKRITTDFLIAWSRIFQLNGILEFMELGGKNDSTVEQALNGARASSTELQEVWFAHWIKTNAFTLRPSDRKREGKKLAELCSAIENGTIAPWNPYPKIWFSIMLNPEDKTDLKGSYYKLGPRKFRPLLTHDWIKPDLLPPLTRQAFKSE